MTRDIAQQQLVTSHFDQVANTYADWYQGPTARAHSFWVRQERVCEMFSRPESQVLDIGCGPGLMVDWLLSQGCTVYGVDVAAGMIEECENRFANQPSAHFQLGDIENMTFQDNFFDSVICMGVLEYLDHQQAAVAEMARVTRPGGEVIVTVPSSVSPWRLWEEGIYIPLTRPFRSLLRRNKYRIYHRSYRQREVAGLLSSHGLVPQEVVYYDFEVVPMPLDRLFPLAASWIARRLEGLRNSWLRSIGTGFIVRTIKE